VASNETELKRLEIRVLNVTHYLPLPSVPISCLPFLVLPEPYLMFVLKIVNVGILFHVPNPT
jgi:hypothetical protein